MSIYWICIEQDQVTEKVGWGRFKLSVLLDPMDEWNGSALLPSICLAPYIHSWEFSGVSLTFPITPMGTPLGKQPSLWSGSTVSNGCSKRPPCTVLTVSPLPKPAIQLRSSQCSDISLTQSWLLASVCSGAVNLDGSSGKQAENRFRKACILYFPLHQRMESPLCLWISV